jgi:DNA-directed RNA polymerase subunit RPC12/RpoP
MRARRIGIVLLVVGLGIAAWLITGLVEATNQKTTISGYVLGLVLFCLPWFAVSLYLLMTSRGEIKEESKADKERTILGAVMTRGRVSVADLAIECSLTREQVRDYVYDLIGKDLFRGYVNWEKGELVSAEAAQIKSDTCPNCGGKVEIAGKGLVRCPFCGTETYLSPPTSGIKAVHSRETASAPGPVADQATDGTPVLPPDQSAQK